MSEASNIPRSRNGVLRQARTLYPQEDTAWILWLDADIVLAPGSAEAVVTAIRWAESHERGVVANYLMASGTSVLMTTRGQPGQTRHYTDTELQDLEDFAEVGMSGLSFAYLPQPLAYTFFADEVGEDIHFWWDHPEVRIHWAKSIRIGHKKLVLLVPRLVDEAAATSVNPFYSAVS